MPRFLLIFFLSLYLFSCEQGAKPGKSLIVATDREPLTINPIFLSDLSSHMISNLVFRGLVSLDRSGTVKPELAESWEIKDERTLIFRLRKNAFWHDGTPFRARDVIFTYKLLNSGKVASPRKGSLGPIVEIKEVDDFTVKVTYSEPFGPMVESWTLGIMPEHIKNAVVEPSFDDRPVGTGPYRLKRWKRGDLMVLEGFERFYEGPPKTKDVIIRFIPDASTRYLELRSGRCDVAELPPHFDNEKLLDRFQVYKANSYRYAFLGLNLLKKEFQDERVRKALAHAVDKERLIKVVLNGNGDLSLGPYPRGTWYFNEDLVPYKYDISKARRLLEEAGKKLNFSIYVSSESTEALKASQLIQDDLKKVGIKTEIKLFDWQTLRHRVLEERDFEAVLMSRAYLWEPDLYDLWHSSKAHKGGWNLFSFKDEEVDRLLERSRRTVSMSERAKIYKEIQSLLYKKQACIFLYETPLIFYAKKEIKGINPDPRGLLYGLENFRVVP
ncbi:MAG: ABC transporter substrate-binding protein [Candidatus Bathyarchaeia archaeon]